MNVNFKLFCSFYFILLLSISISFSQVNPKVIDATTHFDQFEFTQRPLKSDTLIPDTTYTFQVSFEEWEGQSLGEKVNVEFKAGKVKVSYLGEGQMRGYKKGDILEEGFILRHKSGVFIISNDEKDRELEEVGGCTGSPTVINLKIKKYFMC